MSVRVVIEIPGHEIDIAREVVAAPTYADDRHERLREALTVLESIRGDLFNLLGTEQEPIPTPARSIITERGSDGVPVCVRCGVVVDNAMSHFYWHGGLDSNASVTTAKGAR